LDGLPLTISLAVFHFCTKPSDPGRGKCGPTTVLSITYQITGGGLRFCVLAARSVSGRNVLLVLSFEEAKE
jgi:hypothetical protein